MKKLVLLLCAGALVFAADSGRYREDFHYSYPQTPGGRLTVENFNGSVEVTGWDQNTVDVSGAKYAESEELLRALKVDVSSASNAVHVKTVRPERERHGNMGARFVIRVPRQTLLDNVASSNGSLRVEDVEGDAHLSTSNGSVHLAKLRGNIDAHTSNGGVDVNNVNGRMSFRTSNGSIHGGKLSGDFQAETSNGGIDVELDSPPHHDVVARTSNGSVTLRLPDGASGDLHASTSSSGSVRSDFQILTRGELSRHRIDGAIGSGGPRFELVTSNGNIRLLKL